MTRGAFLKLALAGAAWTFGTGHTPYRQWVVYRKRHLLILTSRTDGPSYPLGKRVAEILATHLPASKARVSRAPYTERIASLISTKQMDVALLSRDDAAALLEGRPPFADYGPVPLRVIIGLGNYLLVCRDDFPAPHAYLVARTLSAHRAEVPVPVFPDPPGAKEPDATVPTHPGALAYFEGRPLPEVEAKER
ncbi:MAG: hypothetical protein ACE5JN_09870 [Candidatus Methylomirabilia bacterium]